MRPERWLVAALALTVLLPVAHAGYGEGSRLEAAAPVALDGRVDALYPNGMVSFTSASSGVPLGLTIDAPRLHVLYRTQAAPCDPTASTLPVCDPTKTNEPVDEERTVTGARVTVTRALTAYKALVTTDPAYQDTAAFGDGGRLLATTAAATRIGATTGNATALSASTSGWETTGEHAGEPIYWAEVPNAHATATGAVVTATGGFETFLQGFVVSIEGTDENGGAFRKSYETPVPGEGEPYRVLVLEAGDARLAATSSAPFDGFTHASTRPMWDVRSTARFTDATGTVERADGPTEHANEDLDLAGPLSLTLLKITGDRLSFAIADGLQIAATPTPPADEPMPPGALLAAGAAGAGGAGLLLAAAYFWPRLKFAATLLFLPLYSRIERDSVLEHEKRDELYELIRATPGIHAHEIGEKANIGWGTTVYHLKLLENHGLVVSKKSGRYKRFFVNTGEYTKKKDVYGALRNDTAKAVADFIVNHPGTTQKDMCAALGIQPSLASWHVEKLEGVGLVKRVKDGRQVRYFAGPAWSDLNVRIDPRFGADTPAET